MTFEQFITAHPDKAQLKMPDIDRMRDAWDSSREECAKLCDLHAREIDNTNNVASWLAKAIRERERERVSIVAAKTQELSGPTLDWAVAKCECMHGQAFLKEGRLFDPLLEEYIDYSNNWEKGGPIIEREIICLESGMGIHWWAKYKDTPSSEVDGPTPLIAAMRCYVASKLGDEIKIPEELL